MGAFEHEVVDRFGLVFASFVVAFVSGVFPPINIEIFLLAAAAFTRMERLPAVVASASAGQMAAKALFYLAGRGLMKLPLGRYQSKFDEWSVRLGRSKRGVDVVMFSSASWGIPPFMVTPYLAGMFRMPFARFLVIGTAGRLLRFAAIMLIPVLVRAFAK